MRVSEGLKGQSARHTKCQKTYKEGVSCDQCHPNGANIHPETCPEFQQQLGRVAVLGEMSNWCIMNPLESEPLKLDDPSMVALQAYITSERRGVGLAPGKH